jgi:MFS family permease
LFIGRFIFGFATGVLSVATNRMVDEYIPLQLFSTCSPVFSFALNIGTLIAAFTGVVLPKDDSTTLEYAENTSWRWVYGFPIIFYILIISGFLFFVKTDTPKFLL